jgi:hypothetical protein
MSALLGAVTLGRFLLTLGCEHAVGVQDGGGTRTRVRGIPAQSKYSCERS